MVLRPPVSRDLPLSGGGFAIVQGIGGARPAMRDGAGYGPPLPVSLRAKKTPEVRKVTFGGSTGLSRPTRDGWRGRSLGTLRPPVSRGLL